MTDLAESLVGRGFEVAAPAGRGLYNGGRLPPGCALVEDLIKAEEFAAAYEVRGAGARAGRPSRPAGSRAR